jgi:hypothetical protein
MDQIENIAPLVRLSDIAGMIAPHAGDIRDREARVWGGSAIHGCMLCTAGLTAATRVQGLP